MLGQLPLFASASLLSPAQLTLTGWWRASYGGSGSWVGTASVGSSGSNNLTLGNAPGSGTAVNGFNPADFNGSSSAFNGPGTLDMLINNNAGSILILLNADTAGTANAGAPQNETALIQDSNNKLILSFSTAGTRVTLNDGALKQHTFACATGGWHLLQAKWDGSNLQARLDSGSFSSTAAGNVNTVAGSTQVGINSTGTAFFDGKILEIITAETAFSDDTFNRLKAYVNARYALSL